MNKAMRIMEEIENGLSLKEVLEKYEFDTSLALGSYMYEQGYRFSTTDRRYSYDESLVNQKLSAAYMQSDLRERLSEKNLINLLESQVTVLKDLLDGAFPIQLTQSTQKKLIEHCRAYDLSIDDFIEAAVLERLRG